jgi:hypothetical protein
MAAPLLSPSAGFRCESQNTCDGIAWKRSTSARRWLARLP